MVPVLQKITKIGYIILYNILVFIFPIDEKWILIASNRSKDLNGNLLYIYNGLCNHKKYRVELLLTKKTSIVYHLKLVYRIAKSKYIIIDDFFPLIYRLKIRREAKLIQVWHALGAFKKVGYSRLGKTGGPADLESLSHKNYTDAIVSSKSIVKNYAEAFGIDEEKIHPLGIPRTDVFFEKGYQERIQKQIYDTYPELREKRVMLFAPTFRGDGKKAAYYPEEYINYEMIYQKLDSNTIFILRYHPFINNIKKVPENLKDKIMDFSSYNNINDLFYITDVLITDYSSCIFEYAFLNKPVVYYVPDLEEYKCSRDFYYDFHEYIYGDICYDMESLLSSIEEPKIDEERLQKFKDKFMDACDGQSTQRFINDIILN